MVDPVRELQKGADRIGAGDLTSQIDVKTGDELEDLAGRFNTMTSQLRESYADLERKVQDRTAELRETLEQQTATANILRVISGSPTDVMPVFEAIVKAATELGEAETASFYRYDGERIHYVTSHGTTPEWIEQAKAKGSWLPDQGTMTGRVIQARAIVQIEDMLADGEYRGYIRTATSVEIRRLLGVPLMREGQPIGVLTISWREPGVVPEKFVRLFQTFADQAVIAIENVRLFKETNEALEQQTATADVLKVISSTPTDVMPVFEAIVKAATELGEARTAQVFRYDGERIHYVTSYGTLPEWRERMLERPSWLPDRSTMTGRVVMARAVVQIEDMLADPEYDREAAVVSAPVSRRLLGVPLLREGQPIGVITISWRDPGVVPEKFVRLLQTFADQAVIAIENVRLFKETNEALAQQTATADVLRVISGTRTDPQPVFDAIVRSCVDLFPDSAVGLWLAQGEAIVCPALHDPASKVHGEFPREMPLARQSIIGTCILDSRLITVGDLATQVDEFPIAKLAHERGNRSSLTAPLLRDGKAIGAIAVLRRTVGAFRDQDVELLRTFADQAVIAIENVRLFNEIQDKSRQLEVANKHKSEFLANMSHELRTPLNAIIGFSEVMITGMTGPLADKQKEFILDIRDSGKHLLNLINDILDLAKIEAGRMELDRTRFDLQVALANAMTLVRGRAEQHGIVLETDIADEVGEFEGDERKFKQIVLNLMSNAVKFTPEGGTVTVAAQRIDGSYEFSVKDTGIGIAAEDQETIFEEFRQVGRDYDKKAEGTGLGLSLTRSLVHLHGGTIRVDSAPVKGSTFTFTLPIGTP